VGRVWIFGKLQWKETLKLSNNTWLLERMWMKEAVLQIRLLCLKRLEVVVTRKSLNYSSPMARM